MGSSSRYENFQIMLYFYIILVTIDVDYTFLLFILFLLLLGRIPEEEVYATEGVDDEEPIAPS